jgi:hypothetical protein
LPDRRVIAGRYITLCVLTFYDVFNGEASYYGVSMIEVLATDNFRFESRYMDKMSAVPGCISRMPKDLKSLGNYLETYTYLIGQPELNPVKIHI